MLICESCGAVFEYPSTRMEQDTGYVEESCPECGSYMIERGKKIVCSNKSCGHIEK